MTVGGALTNGLAATGNIDQGNMDLWTFKANLGDTVIVRTGELVAGSTHPLSAAIRT